MKTTSHWVGRLSCALASVLVCLVAASCSSTRTTFLEDGTRGYSISCKGYLNNWNSCLIKAGKICETRGYRTLRSEEYDRTLLIACRSPVAAK